MMFVAVRGPVGLRVVVAAVAPRKAQTSGRTQYNALVVELGPVTVLRIWLASLLPSFPLKYISITIAMSITRIRTE
jgi:hypothetical protein